MSQPEKMWSTLETLINTTKEKVDLTIKLAGKKNPEIPKVIKSESKQRFDRKVIVSVYAYIDVWCIQCLFYTFHKQLLSKFPG